MSSIDSERTRRAPGQVAVRHPSPSCHPVPSAPVLAALTGALLLLGGPFSPVWAGPAFFAGRLEQGAFIPHPGSQEPCFSVLFSSTEGELREDRAKLRIEETVVGTGGETTALGLIPLPVGAQAQEVRVSSGDRDLAGLEGRFLPAAEAQGVYEAIAKARKRTDVLAWVGHPVVLLPSFPLGKKRVITVELDRPLQRQGNLLVLDSPMPLAEFSRQPVERMTFTVRLRHSLPLRAVFSPTHEIQLERRGLKDVVVRATGEQLTASPELRLLYVADEDELGLHVLTHRSANDKEGYFLLLGNPSGKSSAALAKDLLLVLDTSGSMRGEKMEQARTAIRYCLEQLDPRDRFNVVTFGTEVSSFARELVPASPANVEQAATFVDEVEALGRTNISGALAAGLAGTPQGSERPRMMIFLTDGTPTAGELDPARIVERLPALNSSGTRIFVLGMGKDVNTHLLDRLAEDSEGSSEYLAPDEEIDSKVAAIYDRLSSPVLNRVELGFGGLPVQHLYPERLPALFRGSDIFILGRYSRGGQHTLTVNGSAAGQPRTFRVTADFPEQEHPEHEYLASLWASRRIGELLARIRLRGEQRELVEEVVRLSRTYGIVTEYTEFLSTGDQDMTPEQAAAEASRLIGMANVQQAGGWAVNQANNEKALRGQKVAASTANSFVDRLGKKRAATRVKQLGRKVFYEKDGRWVENSDVMPAAGQAPAPAAPAASAAPPKTVQRFSDEYFRLLRSNKDFARAQALDGEIRLEVDGQQVLVK